jgi:Cu/Ag efflux protein CusF
MKKMMICLMVGLLALMFTTVVFAQKEKADKPGGAVVDVITWQATVDAVDLQKRTVTLKGPDGKMKTLTIGPEARNLDQVKKGDQLKVKLIESVALFVRKASDPPDAAEAAEVAVAPKGEKPGMLAVKTAEITGNVQAIDYKKRTVTLKGPEGNLTTLKVGEAAKRFNEVKKGDQVVLRVTEALLIDVTKP